MDFYSFGEPCQPDTLDGGACIMSAEGDEFWIGIVLQPTPDGRKFVCRIWPVKESESSLVPSHKLGSVLHLEQAMIEPMIDLAMARTITAVETGKPGAICQTPGALKMRVLEMGGRLIFIDVSSGSWSHQLGGPLAFWYPGWRILIQSPNSFTPIASFPNSQ